MKEKDIILQRHTAGGYDLSDCSAHLASVDCHNPQIAAYCRVGTQEEQQVGSFDMQIRHFTKRNEANSQWEPVKIYQDEGISATAVEKRLDFRNIIADAVDGRIDRILPGRVSRFTPDSACKLRPMSA